MRLNVKRDFAFSRREAPGVLQTVPPYESQRAQGRPGARCTRGLVCKMHIKKRTRAYRFSGGIRPSLRNGFTAYAALSPATNSSCHRHRRIKVRLTRSGSKNLRRFDISNGCQDHTVLPYASAPFVCAPVDRSRETRPAIPFRANAAASTASRPAPVTIASRPSEWDRTGWIYG